MVEVAISYNKIISFIRNHWKFIVEMSRDLLLCREIGGTILVKAIINVLLRLPFTADGELLNFPEINTC